MGIATISAKSNSHIVSVSLIVMLLEVTKTILPGGSAVPQEQQ
jgi:hypothetical protein